MAASNSALSVAGLSAELEASPTDLDTWYRLARALAQEGEEDGASAFAKLGDAANRLGHVALAVACARQLRDMGRDALADDLVGSVCKLHCRGSAAIDKQLRPSPPPPPGKTKSPKRQDVRSTSMEMAVAGAASAIDKALEAVRKIAPKKLPPTPLVSVLSREELRDLASMVEQRDLAEGSVVIEIGEPATTLFWVARGQLGVFRGEHRLGELRSNSFFGEIALVGSTDRTAKVVAESPVWLLDIPKEELEKLAASSPRLAKVLANYAKARILSNVMKTSGLFSQLTEDERRSLLPRFEPILLDDGDLLLRNGELNDTLFVVASGTVEVRDGKKVVASLSVGDAAGEQSLLSRKAAGFDVVAVGRCVALGLGRDSFDDLVVAHPGLLAEAYKLLVEREQKGADYVHDATNLVI